MSEVRGWVRLLRLALRRDRVLVPVWISALVLSCVSSVRATVDLYPARAARIDAAEGINGNAAIRAIYGPITDVTSTGALATFKLLLLGGVFVAMLGAVLVRRHTRLEEESGRAELVAATGIGRHALLVAAVAEGTLAALLTGVLVALGNTAAGLDLAGSVAFGAAWAGLGLTGVAVSAVACQVTTSTRTAGGIAATVLAATYLLRAVADAAGGWAWLAWSSPFGWAGEVRAYGDARWWVLALPVLLLAAGAAVAVVLASRRDLGSGLYAARPGPSYGGLRTTLALDLRLARPGLLGWAFGMAAVGAVLGGIAPAVADIADSPSAREMLHRLGGAGALVDAFLVTEFAFIALVVTAYGVSAVVRAAGEEESGRTEQVLGAGATRRGTLGALGLVALGGPVVLALCCGVGAAVGFGSQSGGIGRALTRLVPAVLAAVPATWVVVALALLLLGVRRAWAVLGWAVLAAFVLLGQLGELLGLPSALTRLSPYSHVPRLPGGTFALGPELVLTAIAAALAGTAWWRYEARDLG